jgi:hypothetical protein
MVRLLGLAGVVLFGATLHRVAVADEPKGKAAAPDPTAQLLEKLRQPLALPGGEMTVAEFAAAVEKATGVGVAVNAAGLGSLAGGGQEDDMPKLRPVRFKGATAAAVLRLTLARADMTYLVRRNHVEVVGIDYARAEVKQPANTDGNGGEPVAPAPLVSAVIREKPLTEALSELAAEHDLTVVLAPQAADQKAAFVTARLLNVPADRAVELLAVQADLRVVRRGAAFLVTTKDHSDALFNERQERARQKVELQNLRNAPLGGGQLGQPGRGNGAGLCGAIGGNVGLAGNGGFGGVAGASGLGGFGFAGRPH